jgi:peptidyl-prolyl cis-trans isomerase D
MLQNIRDNSQGTVAKIIVGFIVVMFSLFGVESIISLAGQAGAPVVVNGDDISENEIAQAVAQQKRQLAQRFGSQFDESMLDEGMLRNMAINQLVERKVMLQSVIEQNLAYSTDSLDADIRQTPAFQVEGKFNSDQFKTLLAQSGYTPLSYRQTLMAEAVINQARVGYANSDFITDAEVKQISLLENQTRDFDLYKIDVADSQNNVTVSQEETQSYYDKHKQRYKTQEAVSLEYVQLDKSLLLKDIKVTDAEIEDAYRIKKEQSDEQERRQAAHIMILVDGNRSEKEAKERAALVNEKLAKGESFADLAKEFSDDFASAEQGGDLGLNAMGVYGDALDSAIFELDVNEVSAPVETDDGLHIVKLLKINKPVVAKLSEIKDELVTQIKLDKAGVVFAEKSEELANIAFSSEDLAEPAEAMMLTVQTTTSFTAMGGQGIAANKAIVAAAFSDELLKNHNNSELIELNDNQSVIIRVKQHTPASVKSLDDVSETIVAQLKNEKAREAAIVSAAALVASIQSDMSVSADAKKLTKVKRSETKDVDATVVAKAFSMAKPASSMTTVDSVVLNNGDVAVVVLRGVNDVAVESNEGLTKRLEAEKGYDSLNAFKKALKESADIERT